MRGALALYERERRSGGGKTNLRCVAAWQGSGGPVVEEEEGEGGSSFCSRRVDMRSTGGGKEKGAVALGRREVEVVVMGRGGRGLVASRASV